MRGEIELQFRVIQPYTGKAERLPDGSFRSTYQGPTVTIRLNPDLVYCLRPLKRTATSAYCAQEGDYLAAEQMDRLVELVSASQGDYLDLRDNGYADGKDAGHIRAVLVDVNTNGSQDISNLSRGRMHPHDALGRVIGMTGLIDWNDLMAQANAVE